jgi:hypothetical protein
MRKISLIAISLLSLIILFSCEKDETRAVLSDTPGEPGLNVPSTELVLQRANATQVLVFSGAAADFGFQAAISYSLEAVIAGSSFDSPTTLATAAADTFALTVADLNAKLLEMGIAEYSATQVEMRVKAIVISTVPAAYSAVNVVTATLYGLPRLVLSTTPEQGILSPAGDGNYGGLVKLEAGVSFTLTDLESGKTYGGVGGVLSENGAPIVVETAGWYNLTASTVDLVYAANPYFIGLVGSATPNQWNAPDQKMDYDPATGTWSITIDLVDGDIKFRLNDDWAWNLGGTTDNLTHNGANIPVTAGNYTIVLTITNATVGSETGTFTITAN